MTEAYQTEVHGRHIDYELRRSKEATEPRIDVDIEGVRVVLPEESDADPEQLLAQSGRWVLEKMAKYDQYRAQAPDRSFESGERFPYLGEECELVVESRPRSEVTGGTIRLRQSAVDQASVRRVLENFYRRQAREHLTSRVEHYADEMGVEYAKIEIRNQRTKWGSCSTTGTLGLNWRLIMAPPEIVDYVVIHELAHLREPKHTDAFWSLVADYDPDFQNHVAWLERHSTKLIFSDEDL